MVRDAKIWVKVISAFVNNSGVSFTSCYGSWPYKHFVKEIKIIKKLVRENTPGFESVFF